MKNSAKKISATTMSALSMSKSMSKSKNHSTASKANLKLKTNSKTNTNSNSKLPMLNKNTDAEINNPYQSNNDAINASPEVVAAYNQSQVLAANNNAFNPQAYSSEQNLTGVYTNLSNQGSQNNYNFSVFLPGKIAISNNGYYPDGVLVLQTDNKYYCRTFANLVQKTYSFEHQFIYKPWYTCPPKQVNPYLNLIYLSLNGPSKEYTQKIALIYFYDKYYYYNNPKIIYDHGELYCSNMKAWQMCPPNAIYKFMNHIRFIYPWMFEKMYSSWTNWYHTDINEVQNSSNTAASNNITNNKTGNEPSMFGDNTEDFTNKVNQASADKTAVVSNTTLSKQINSKTRR